MYNKFALLFFLSFICFVFVAFGQQSQDTIAEKRNIDGLHFLYVNNPWVHTQNPAALADLDIYRLVDVHAGYVHTTGDYTNYNQPESVDQLHFSTSGYTRGKKLCFFGKLAYDNSTEKQLRWNNNSFLAAENPFRIADSIGGDYDNERFLLQAKIAGQNTNETLKWGVDLHYKVGNKVDQTDPRPEISSMLFGINPGVRIVRGAWEFGANIGIDRFLEEVSFTVEDHYTNYRYFRMMGFGEYLGASDDTFAQSFHGWKYSAALQALYHTDRWSNRFELYANRDYQRAEERTSRTSFLAGDYTALQAGFSNELRLFQNKHLHCIHFMGDFMQVKGKWFDQNQINGPDGTTYWNVYNESVRYKKNIIQAQIHYEYLPHPISVNTTQKWQTGVSMQMELANFYPEKYKQDISNLHAYMGWYRQWQWTNTHIAVDLQAAYRYNFQDRLKIQPIELLERITNPDHYYRTTDLLQFRTNIKFGFPKLLNGPHHPYLALETRWDQTMGELPSAYFEEDAYRLYTGIKLGLVF